MRDFAKDSTIRRVLPAAAVLLGAAYLAASSCSSEEPEPRLIRAHTTIRDGVPHAEPHLRSERFCSECHGVGLAGGSAMEPSCYQCHGKTWVEDGAALVAAPADHTVAHTGKNGVYLHAPGLMTPDASCASCHVIDPAAPQPGGLKDLPSCQLCHTPLWEERAP